MLTLLLPVTRPWAREAVCAAIAASDIPRGRCILVLDAPGCGLWADTLGEMGFRVEVHLRDRGVPCEDRLGRRIEHDEMRAYTIGLVPDGELLILDDDTIVPPDVYARLSAVGPHSTGIQVSRWGNALCGVYRDGHPLVAGSGVEDIDYCGHYCLLTTGEMYRKTARHTPHQCFMQPIPGLRADWDCLCGHLTKEGVLWPTSAR